MTRTARRPAASRPAIPALPGALRRAISVLVATVLAVLSGLVSQLAVPSLLPGAAAATYTASTYDWGDCSFRQPGDGGTTRQANSLCWLDWSGITMPTTSTQVVSVTRQIGRYTLSFELTRPQIHPAGSSGLYDQVSVMSSSAVSSDANAAFLKAFPAFSGDSTQSIVNFNLNGVGQAANLARVQLNNIKLVDDKGAVVPGFSLVMADAGANYNNEGLSLNSGAADASVGWNFVTPTGSVQACSYSTSKPSFDYETGLYIAASNQSLRDFACMPKEGSGNVGTFLASQVSPKNLTASVWGPNTQSFALAINIGRMGGSVSSDTNYEFAATGQRTTFDLTARLAQFDGSNNETAGTAVPVPLPADGTMTDVVRTTSTVNSDILYPADRMVFASKASGTDAALVFKRYDPVWTCTAGSSAPITIKAGGVPAGYLLTNDATTGTSTLVAANSTNAPLDCDVFWQPKYTNAQLTLGKTVNGTASGFPEVQLRTYQLNYSCTSNTSTGFDAPTYLAAYPGNSSLSGSVVLQKGQTKTVQGLPVGASCTLTETFPDGNPPAKAGKNLDQTWTGGGSDTATTTNPISSTTGSSTLRTRTVTLTASTNDTANNQYDYRAGTLHITKELLGQPVGEFTYPRTYQFSLSCAGTDVRGQIFKFDITKDAQGKYTGGIDVQIPVARDCYITPLSGLSAAESQLYKFDGRVVTQDGTVVPASTTSPYQGSYLVRLPDYAPGTTATSSDVHFAATYSYQLRDLKVIKQLVGAAAGSSEVTAQSFTAEYSCTWGNTGQYSKTGTTAITTDTTNPAVVAGLPVGAKCMVWEQTPATLANNTLKSTTVSFNDLNDQNTTLSNADAQTKVVAVVQNSTEAIQNRVIITNDYEPRLGTLQLTKAVVDNGLAASSLPTDFTLHFDCGYRSVVAANGSVTSVAINGDITLQRDASGKLVARTGDSTNDALVNDQSGVLGIPYGNTCTFSEAKPTMPVAGVLWTTDADTESITVDSSTVDANGMAKTTVTNTFTPAGNGLTITQRVAHNAQLAQPVSYTLACKTSAGTAIDLGSKATFTLDSTTDTITVPAATVPAGSTCTLTETPNDPRTRTAGSTTYPVTRSSQLTMAADGSDPAIDTTIADPQPITVNLTVGDSSVLTIANDYDYVTANITVDKNVAFDPATVKYISAARQQVKLNRQFNITLVCTPPGGGTSQTTTAVISDQTNDVTNPATTLSSTIPVGSSCTLGEGTTTTSTGVTVDQQVSVNGASNTPRSQAFTVVAGTNTATVTNTYARTMAHVQLTKQAHLPGDVVGQYQQAGKDIPFYTHTFTLTCKDPATNDADVLSTATATITGPGEATYADVPVGADCRISGDNFGELDLALTHPQGVPLRSHLLSKEVRWVVDANDGTATIDTDFTSKDTTTSQVFPTVADSADGTVNNTVLLDNTYDYTTTQIQMTKQVVATQAGFDLLGDKPVFDFTYQCKGVGYQNSTIGSGADTLPSQVSLATSGFGPAVDNGDGTLTRTWTSPKVTVPEGAYCTFTEAQMENTPPQLDGRPDQAVVTGYAPDEDTGGKTSWDFTNRYTRRFVPVRLAMLQDGYLVNANPAGYTLAVTCTDPKATSATVTVPLSGADSVSTVADAAPPASGDVVQLPAGADCTLSLDGSPALAARPRLEVTAGSRTPYVAFGTWTGDIASDANPDTRPADLPLDQVTAAMKAYTYTFTIAPDVVVPTGEDVAMTVAAEAMHPRDQVQLTLAKQVEGSIGQGASFTFTSSCFTTPVTLVAGATWTSDPIDVDSQCTISETDDGVPAAEAQLTVADAGASLAVGDPTNTNAVPADGTNPAQPGTHQVTTTLLPVASATDTSSSGAPWTLSLLNRFPSMQVSKTIAGGAVSSVTGAAADTAVLPSDATTMQVSYTITNDGAQALGSFTLTDPSMAGRTLTRDGTTVVVGADGVIPASFCGLDGNTLASGLEYTCTFTASIDQAPPSLFSTRGTLTVTADAEGTALAASDTYGAIRPVPGLLPETGMQTLVWILGLGLAVLAIGLWRRRRDGSA